MAEKVYVLYTDIKSREKEEINVEIYAKKEKALEIMETRFNAELNDWESWCPKEFLKINRGTSSCSVFESGNYDYNHYTLVIHEREVIQ